MKLPKKKYIVLGSAALVLLLAALVCFLLGTRAGHQLQSQQQAQRWAGESGERFTQFSAFFSENAGLALNDVSTLRQKLNEKLTAASIEAPTGGRLFCDAWSASGSAKVQGPRGSFDAGIIAVGGSFFDFHPQELCSGCFLAESDLMKDRVVLDAQLAWLLYGSTDLAGLTVSIGEQELVIAGVVARDGSRGMEKVSDGAPQLYLPYETWLAMHEGAADCYEIVLPDPAEGFAKSLLEECLPKEGRILRRNTGRFEFSESLRALKGFSTRAVRREAIAFPAWENAALWQETRCTLLYVLGLVLLAFPAVLVCILLVRLLRLAKRKLRGSGKRLREKALDRIDARRERRMQRRGSGSHRKGKG